MTMQPDAICQSLMDDLFSTVRDPHLAAALTRLLDVVRLEHRVHERGPVRQSFLITHPDARRGNLDVARGRGRASLHLELACATVYRMHVTGCIDDVLSQVEHIGAWLLGRRYDEASFTAHDQALSALLHRHGARHSTARLDRAALATPYPTLSPHMAQSMCLAALNTLLSGRNLPVESALPDQVEQYLMAQYRPDHEAVESFLARLHAPALMTTRRIGDSLGTRRDPLTIYNLLVEGDGALYRNRSQAAAALPWLYPLMARVFLPMPAGDLVAADSTTVTTAKAVFDVIDTGQPLFATVAQAFGVAPETVRWSRKMTLPPNWDIDWTRMGRVLTMVSWLPPEKRPRMASDWQALRTVCNALRMSLSSVVEQSAIAELSREPRFARIMRHWIRNLLRPDLAAAQDIVSAMQAPHDRLSEISDYLRVILRSLHRFCDHSAPDTTGTGDPCLALLLDWACKVSLQQMLARSRTWHASLHNEANGAVPPSPQRAAESQAWPILLSQPLCTGTLNLVELANTEDLQEEGLIMDHCVGTYGQECLAANRLIFSIRNLAGRRLSTVEVHIEVFPLRVRLGQHRGPGNTLPALPCQAAAAALVAWINRPDHIKNLYVRHDFQQAQRRTQRARTGPASTATDAVLAQAEIRAWSSVFSAPPDSCPRTIMSLSEQLGLA